MLRQLTTDCNSTLSVYGGMPDAFFWALYSLVKTHTQTSSHNLKIKYLKEISIPSWEVVAHTFNLSTCETKASRSLWVQDHPGVQELLPGQGPKLKRNHVLIKINKQKFSIPNIIPIDAIMCILTTTLLPQCFFYSFTFGYTFFFDDSMRSFPVQIYIPVSPIVCFYHSLLNG